MDGHYIIRIATTAPQSMKYDSLVRNTLKWLSITFITLPFTATLFAAPAASPQNSPQKLARALYTEVLAHQPNGIPEGALWDTFAPYFSARLLHSIDQSRACAADWKHQDANPARTARVVGKFGIFLGNEAHLQSFAIQKTENQPDGTTRVYVNLVGHDAYESSWRTAVIVTNENDHFTIDDIIYLDDNTWDNETDRRNKYLSHYLSAGCKGPQWIGPFLPKDPAALAQSLYAEVVAHPTSGIPSGEDWKIFAPYLSQPLLRRIDVYDACIADEVRKYAAYKGPPMKLASLDETGIFSGGDEEEAPRTIQVEKVKVQIDGTVHVTVKLGLPQYQMEWPVIDIFTQESGRLVLKDIIFPDEFTHKGVKDPRPSEPDAYLSNTLAMTPECHGTRWTGHF